MLVPELIPDDAPDDDASLADGDLPDMELQAVSAKAHAKSAIHLDIRFS